LLAQTSLIEGGERAPVAALFAKLTFQQFEIRDSFYAAYYNIRADLLRAIEQAVSGQERQPSRDDLLTATQRLLDRMLFLYYCEDHPDHLIPPNTVRTITTAARGMPGPDPAKVYRALKQLFREVDQGSSPYSGIKLPAYNGELFKEHTVLDHIDLPDSLHDHNYPVEDATGRSRVIHGVWGLHEFDFWRELNEHLLGHIFEESLSDLVQLKSGAEVTLSEKLRERKEHGIYFTTQVLSDFLTASALDALFSQDEVDGSVETDAALEWIQLRMERLAGIRILDCACGSGAFLVSAYRELLKDFWRLSSAATLLRPVAGSGEQMTLDALQQQLTQASLLRNCLFGADLLPQAVEIAKLALWLRSARYGERVADLGDNIVAGDSLEFDGLLRRLKSTPGSFDLVVGNPPWGANLDPTAYADLCTQLGIAEAPEWDSWELFVLLSLELVKSGGRVALLVPDTIFSPEKERTRRLLLERTQIEKLHNFGPDWFGPKVRMGTCILQVKKEDSLVERADFSSVLLTGGLRRQVIRGEVPPSQIEARFSRTIPQERSLKSPTAEIEIFRSRTDDEIMSSMEAHSEPLAQICDRYRGEEMAKSGLLWVCPNCMHRTTPGRKLKGGNYDQKQCPNCGLLLTEKNVSLDYLVMRLVPDRAPDAMTAIEGTAFFIDGDDIAHRYVRVKPTKIIQRSIADWEYKPPFVYENPKILIRQAGVGLFATLDTTGAYCPQSVYIYRLKPENARYSHQYVLAALLSRTMAYYVFKRFAEVDPARAHAKLTHERLQNLPIPRLDFSRQADRQMRDRIVARVTSLLEGTAELGGTEDLEVEQDLRNLWGLTPEHGQHINGEFAQLPDSQVIRDLFPHGRVYPGLRIVSNS
jgi:hypothetical protein